MCFVTQGVGAKGFERRSGGLAEGSIESLDTGEAFPQFGAHAGGDLVESVEHMLLVWRGGFFAGNIVAVGGVLGIEGNDVGLAQWSDGAYKDSFAALPLADLAGNLGGNGLVLLAAEELQTLAKVLLADDVEHRGLAQLHAQSLVQGGVKNRGAGFVDKSAKKLVSFAAGGATGLTLE